MTLTGSPAGRFAAYNGTAPIEVSSGNRKVHGLSRRGNRRLNHAVRSGSGRPTRPTSIAIGAALFAAAATVLFDRAHAVRQSVTGRAV